MQEGLLQSMKAEMVKTRQENEKLKATLAQLITEYKSLEVHYHRIIQQKETNKNLDATSKVHDYDHQESHQKHSEFTSLNYMGEDSTGTKHENNTELFSKTKEKCTRDHHEDQLVLTLDSKYKGSDPEDSCEEPNEVKEKRTWSLSEMPKKSKGEEDRDDQETPQPTVKRARVSVRARCDAPTVCPYAFNY